jgi:hypothetical protein
MKLTSNEVKRVIGLFYSNNSSPTAAARAFNTWAAANNSNTRISKKNVMDALSRFQTKTELQRVVKGRPPASTCGFNKTGLRHTLQNPQNFLCNPTLVNASYRVGSKPSGRHDHQTSPRAISTCGVL